MFVGSSKQPVFSGVSDVLLFAIEVVSYTSICTYLRNCHTLFIFGIFAVCARARVCIFSLLLTFFVNRLIRRVVLWYCGLGLRSMSFVSVQFVTPLLR